MGNTSGRELPLSGVLNARELGGIPLRGGRAVRPGMLIRTGRLSDMTEEDRRCLLTDWKLTTILDLRNDQEIAANPDPAMDGVTHCQVPIFPGLAGAISREDHQIQSLEERVMMAARHYAGGKATKLLREMYPEMVEKDYCIRGVRLFFEKLLKQEDGALIWHCTSGKDRTGITGALLLHILGASWETIAEEYLLTNVQTEEYRQNLVNILRRLEADEESIEQIIVLESVDLTNLENCWKSMEKQCGSVDNYIEKVLGLDKEKRQLLCEKYTYTEL